jgi:drug/metabolite transporter (DMT)-like permease
MSRDAQRVKAVQMLIVANVFWGLSFPTTKALAIAQQSTVPGGNSWFMASLCVVYRFGAAALVMLLLSARTLKAMTRSEMEQGFGLGLFAGLGILLQVDGLTYTAASISAFLTQCYCLIIPLWVALRERRRPARKVFSSCALVIAGVAVLAGVDWRHLRLGRGELETIAASLLFTGQILWLERPKYIASKVSHFSLVMFATMALICLPVALLSTQQPADWIRAYSSAPTLGMLVVLVFFCTLGGYMLMNHWQRHLTATQAGLIYCIEPVFASAFALFLPAWFSAWAVIQYPNEKLTANLLIGGGLITAANLLIQWPSGAPRGAATVAANGIPLGRPERPDRRLDDVAAS